MCVCVCVCVCVSVHGVSEGVLRRGYLVLLSCGSSVGWPVVTARVIVLSV